MWGCLSVKDTLFHTHINCKHSPFPGDLSLQSTRWENTQYSASTWSVAMFDWSYQGRSITAARWMNFNRVLKEDTVRVWILPMHDYYMQRLPSGVLGHSDKYAHGNNPEAQCAFKSLMIHEVLQFALHITFRCVLHRCGTQDIHCQKLYGVEKFQNLTSRSDPETIYVQVMHYFSMRGWTVRNTASIRTSLL